MNITDLEKLTDQRLARRLLAKIRVEDKGHETPCWVWTGSLSEHGYGCVWFRDAQSGRRSANYRAYRLIYEKLVGPIPRHLEIDHLCRVRQCVRPDHMDLVTHAENNRRSAAAVLTASQVRAIRKMVGTQLEIAQQFGVSRVAISHIQRGYTWADVLDEEEAA